MALNVRAKARTYLRGKSKGKNNSKGKRGDAKDAEKRHVKMGA